MQVNITIKQKNYTWDAEIPLLISDISSMPYLITYACSYTYHNHTCLLKTLFHSLSPVCFSIHTSEMACAKV